MQTKVTDDIQNLFFDVLQIDSFRPSSSRFIVEIKGTGKKVLFFFWLNLLIILVPCDSRGKVFLRFQIKGTGKKSSQLS
jgi:hypothetical protein